MASRLYKQFLYSNNPMLTFIEGSFAVQGSGTVFPSTGAVGTSGVIGSGCQSVIKTGTGQYQIQLTDNFYRLLDFQALPISPTSGGAVVSDGSLVVGKPYQIMFASTSTNWQTLGLPKGITPAIGQPFVASSGASNGPSGSSGATAAGNGTVLAVGLSGVTQIELLPNPNLVLSSSPPASYVSTQGAYINIQTLGTSNTLASPSSGTVIRFNLTLRNSSLLGSNETSTNY